MIISPESKIYILSNIPIDNTYDNTLYFTNAENQNNYFLSKAKYNRSNYTYQRSNSNTIRVDIRTENLYDCNYLLFQNSAFGTKWFYAFITSVDYVNNETSDIHYEIDVMQTWFFDYAMEQCFVEREHTASDVIGEHIEAEPVSTGEYVFNDYSQIMLMREMVVCVAIVDTDGESAGTLYDGIYGAAQLFVYDSTDVSSINGKINEYTQKPDSILGIYMFPKSFLLNSTIPENHLIEQRTSATSTVVLQNALTGTETLDGYLPRNKKLYTYPYNFYHVDNASGNELSLRYEFFDNLRPVVEISGTITQPVTAILRPCSYKGVASYSDIGGWTTLNTETLQMSNYPICSWNVDAYQAWVAQNSIPLALGVASKTAQGFVSGAGVGGMVSSAIGQVTNIVSQAYTASISADIAKGNLNNGGANVANGKQQFYGGRCSITAQYARIIDDFFTRFGYAVKRVKLPNRVARPHWNYVKTIDFSAKGSIPSDDMKKICSIYNNGITFWKNPNEVGNYSLDNSI